MAIPNFDNTTRLALVSASLALLLASLGTSIANVALPTIAVAFTASFQSVQWIVLAYLLAITGSIVGVGALGDRIGRRRLLEAGLGLFAVGSLVSGLGSALWVVVVARGVQGVGAAIIMALTTALVSEIVGKSAVGRAMGLLGSVSAVGTAIGPVLGGLLVAAFSWRAIFVVQAPLALIAWALVHRWMPTDQPSRTTAGFVDRTMLRDRSLAAALLSNTLVSAVIMATLVVGPFYLARGLGFGAREVGLALSVGPIVATLAGFPAGQVVDRFGPERITRIGLLGLASASAILTLAPESLGIAGYLAPIGLLTASYALFQAANNTAVMRDVAPDRRGLVAGTLNLSRNLGLIAGVAVMGVVFTLGSGTDDVATAAPERVAAGMRACFAFGAGLLVLALLLVLAAGRRTANPLPVIVAASLLAVPGVAAAQPPAESAPAPSLRSSLDRGFVLRSRDGANSLRILGLFQPQYARGFGHDPANDTLFINRARVGLIGSVLSSELEYTFVAEFGGGDPRLLFAQLDYTIVRDALTVRVGQFKRPFSRPFITMASQLAMIDRPPMVGPDAFGDNADVGVMLHNGSSGRFEYSLGVFAGAGPNLVPARMHPLLGIRLGYNSGGIDPYRESDLEGRSARFSVAAAGLVDFDADGDDQSFVSGLVDAMVKVHGLALSAAVYVGSHQFGPRWSNQRLDGFGHYTQVGYVIAKRFEPVVRYSWQAHDRRGQQQLGAGFNVFVHGHAFKWQNFVTVAGDLDAWASQPDVRVQSQLSLAF